MNRTRHKHAALFFLIPALMISVPVGLMWRQIHRQRLNAALIAAVKANDDRAAVTLLMEGASADCRDETSRKTNLWEALMQAVRGRKSHAPTPLMINLEPAFWLHPSARAADNVPRQMPENVPLVRALLDHGARVNRADEDGHTPMECAIMEGKNATIRLLLARGANAKEPGLLELAADSAVDVGVIADLLDHGADVNLRQSQGYSPLRVAVMNYRVDLVRLLLARHADVTVREDGLTILAWALQDYSMSDNPSLMPIIQMLKVAGARK